MPHAVQLQHLDMDTVIENGGTTEEAARLAELLAEGGWGADADETLTRYDGKGDMVEVIESSAKSDCA